MQSKNSLFNPVTLMLSLHFECNFVGSRSEMVVDAFEGSPFKQALI